MPSTLPLENKRWMWAIAGSIVGGLILVLAVLSNVFPGSHSFHLPRGVPGTAQALIELRPDQCEPLSETGVFAEPQNTWSNIAYILCGILGLLRSRSLIGRLFCASFLVVGITSAAYHAYPGALLPHAVATHDLCSTAKSKGTTWLDGGPFQEMDVIWLYVCLFLANSYALHSFSAMFWKLPKWIWLVALPLYAIALVVAYFLKHCGLVDSTIMFIALVVPLVLGIVGLTVSSLLCSGVGDAERRRATEQFGSGVNLLWQVGLAGAVFACGAVFRLNDGHDGVVPKSLCLPNALWQPHAMWHVLSAFALLFTYDLFAQFQQGKPRPDRDLPVLLDESPALVFPSLHLMLTLCTALGAALMIGFGLGEKPNPYAVVFSAFIFLVFLCFQIVVMTRKV